MSLTDSIRGLKEEVQRNTGLPNKIFMTTFPPLSRDEEWMKRRSMESRWRDRQQDEWEDLTWSIPDLPGGEW